MAIMKAKWLNFINKGEPSINAKSEALFNSVAIQSLVSEIDAKIGGKISQSLSSVGIADILSQSLSYLGNNTLWEDMDIYYSSFKEKDRRIITIIYNKLLQYLGFYNKILTNDGVAKNIAKARNYGQNGTSSSTNKNYYSETPQVGNLNFEEALSNYASNIGKDTNDETNALVGNSSETESGTTWKESLENVRMVFYNDLIDFIAYIPNMIYSYYALESRPYPALIKEYIKSLKNVWDIEK